MEQPKKRGRPRKAADEKLERVTWFVPLDVRMKVEQHGQPWMRAALKRAKTTAR